MPGKLQTARLRLLSGFCGGLSGSLGALRALWGFRALAAWGFGWGSRALGCKASGGLGVWAFKGPGVRGLRAYGFRV